MEREGRIRHEDPISLSAVVDRALADFWSRETFTIHDIDGSKVPDYFTYWTAGAQEVDKLIESGQNPVGLFFSFVKDANLTPDEIIKLEVFKTDPFDSFSHCFAMILEDIVQRKMEQKDPRIMEETNRREGLYRNPSKISEEEFNDIMDRSLERVGLARITPRTP